MRVEDEGTVRTNRKCLVSKSADRNGKLLPNLLDTIFDLFSNFKSIEILNYFGLFKHFNRCISIIILNNFFWYVRRVYENLISKFS